MGYWFRLKEKCKRTLPLYLTVYNVMKMSGEWRFGSTRIQGGSNMTGTGLCVNKPHCAAAVRL